MSESSAASPSYVLPLTRAHLRYLNILPIRASTGDTQELRRVIVEPSALHGLRRALELPVPRTGVPFGIRQGEQLRIRYVATGGASTVPFTLTPHYLLGLADAYQQVNPALDWVGHWITLPDDTLFRQVETLGWCVQARHQALISTEHPLLAVGWVEGQFHLRAIVMGDLDGTWRELEVSGSV